MKLKASPGSPGVDEDHPFPQSAKHRILHLIHRVIFGEDQKIQILSIQPPSQSHFTVLLTLNPSSLAIPCPESSGLLSLWVFALGVVQRLVDTLNHKQHVKNVFKHQKSNHELPLSSTFLHHLAHLEKTMEKKQLPLCLPFDPCRFRFSFFKTSSLIARSFEGLDGSDSCITEMLTEMGSTCLQQLGTFEHLKSKILRSKKSYKNPTLQRMLPWKETVQESGYCKLTP